MTTTTTSRAHDHTTMTRQFTRWQRRCDDARLMRPHNTTWQWTIHRSRHDDATRQRTTLPRDDTRHDDTIIHDIMARTIHYTTIHQRHNTQQCDGIWYHGTWHNLAMTRQQDTKTTWRRDDAMIHCWREDMTRRDNTTTWRCKAQRYHGDNKGI